MRHAQTHVERIAQLFVALVVLATLPRFATAATPEASGPPSRSAAPYQRIPVDDPLNGGFLVVNMHGFLFHPLDSDLEEDVAYARWLGGGVIRVFATDNNGFQAWDGHRVGARIADIAPVLRARGVRLIVAFVNNHRAVPGEGPGSFGWMDGYMQLLLPFYTTNWRGSYLSFVRALISEVETRDALDVIFAWELGNEIHTPQDPSGLVPFITESVDEIRSLDATTPILPGTMGSNHLEPGQPRSSIARWLYCEAPVDAYTLHAYDWVSPDQSGDMPVHWDLDTITAEPCPSGRRLPVIVEELGTSRVLPGVYAAHDERDRLAQELRQIEFIRRYPQVVGFGVWNGESPRLIDRTFVDTRRGLTSYGSDGRGGGSCYDPTPDSRPGARCELEQTLRQLPFARVEAAQTWLPIGEALDHEPPVGGLDARTGGEVGNGLRVRGWLSGAAADTSYALEDVTVVLGLPSDGGKVLAHAEVPAARTAEAASAADGTSELFMVDVPLVDMPPGANSLSVVARTSGRGAWYQSLAVVVPSLGDVPVRARKAVDESIPLPPPVSTPRLDVRWPQPGATVAPSFLMEVKLSDSSESTGAFVIDVFLEPGRDHGGHIVGSASGQVNGPVVSVPATIPPGEHTLYVHARLTTAGPEMVVEIPVSVRS